MKALKILSMIGLLGGVSLSLASCDYQAVIDKIKDAFAGSSDTNNPNIDDEEKPSGTSTPAVPSQTPTPAVPSQTPTPTPPITSDDAYHTDIKEDVVYDDFQIHFMMLGNDKAGDSIYIKAGNTDVLIDAGSRQNSVETTIPYINQYNDDDTISYVIVSHCDSDHISGFTSSSSTKGIFDTYKIGTIIDNRYTTKATTVYEKYKEKRDWLVNNTGTKHYTAADCYNYYDGATRDFELSDNVTMSILYNEYYFNANNSDENNFSVCTMFTYDTGTEKHYFMFTGDLEKEGEEKMVAYYDGSTEEKTLPEVDLFKAGHHGSKTSSNDCLLSIIKPKMCVISCCCGTNEYTGVTDNQFPTQQFISRISKYTDRVYITSICETYEIATAGSKANGTSDTTGVAVGGNYIKSSGFKAMNGNIVVSCSNSGVGLWASNNLTKLKDSEWLNAKITIDGVERPMRIWG